MSRTGSSNKWSAHPEWRGIALGGIGLSSGSRGVGSASGYPMARLPLLGPQNSVRRIIRSWKPSFPRRCERAKNST